MFKKNIYIYLGIASILLIIVLVLGVILSGRDSQSPQIPSELTTPTPAPGTRSPGVGREASKPLEGDDFDQFIESVQSRSRLSEQDRSIRNELISQGDGADKRDLYSTSAFTLRYVPSADVFHVEILEGNIEAVRSSALAYLRSLGLSDEGICNLPVVFYEDPKRNNPNLTTGLYFYEFLDTCPDR